MTPFFCINECRSWVSSMCGHFPTKYIQCAAVKYPSTNERALFHLNKLEPTVHRDAVSFPLTNVCNTPAIHENTRHTEVVFYHSVITEGSCVT